MKNSYIFLFIVSICFSFGSCKKFTDVRPKGFIVPSTYKDYDLLLNSRDLCFAASSSLYHLADEEDYVSANPLSLTDTKGQIYLWADQFTKDIKVSPPFWSDYYANIYIYNTVLTGISVNDTHPEAKRLRAEALVGRAFEYLYLINLYAKPYNSSTAAKDLGIPFVVSIELSDETPKRETLQANYKQILNDLKSAIPFLKDDNSAFKFRPDKRAAFSVLARTYLMMNNYDSAAAYALKAEQGHSVLNLNNIADPDNFDYLKSPSSILHRSYYFSERGVNLAFLNSYDTSDLRLKLYYTGLNKDSAFSKRGVAGFNGYNFPTTTGTTIEEMKLIVAEAAVAKNDLPTALNNLNEIRINKYTTGSYIPLASNNKDTVFKWVFEERKKQMAFTGMRWFDMRRLDAMGKINIVNRYDQNGNIITSLKPGSTKYVLKIPAKVLFFNPDMPQN